MHRAQSWAVPLRGSVKGPLMSEEGEGWLKGSGALLKAASCRQDIFWMFVFSEFHKSFRFILKYFLFSFLYIYFLAVQHVGSSFPSQELNPCSLQWECGLFTTGPLGSPWHNSLNLSANPYVDSINTGSDGTVGSDVWSCTADILCRIIMQQNQAVFP